MYKTLAMGRKTYQSLPVREFKNRHIIVVTNNLEYKIPQNAKAVSVCTNWLELIEKYEHPKLSAIDCVRRSDFVSIASSLGVRGAVDRGA
jgi:dihydrofolate reductase